MGLCPEACLTQDTLYLEMSLMGSSILTCGVPSHLALAFLEAMLSGL